MLYFDMPEYVKGRQLKSYGGALEYTVLYRGQGRQTSDTPHIILSVSVSLADEYNIITNRFHMTNIIITE